MPETPDFDQIAEHLLDALARAGGGDRPRLIAEQLRQVWNARGAVDAEQVVDTDERMAIRDLDR